MSRRSTRLMRLENSLYNYNLKKECWDVKEVVAKSQTDNTNLFEIGSYFTCKHMSQKVNPLSFRIGQNRSWYSAWFSQYKYFGIDTGKFQIDLYIRWPFPDQWLRQHWEFRLRIFVGVLRKCCHRN